jgi:hypothetical protein
VRIGSREPQLLLLKGKFLTSPACHIIDSPQQRAVFSSRKD